MHDLTCDDLRFLSECRIPVGWVSDPRAHQRLADRMRPTLDAAVARGQSDVMAFWAFPIDELHGDSLASWLSEGLPRPVVECLVHAMEYR